MIAMAPDSALLLVWIAFSGVAAVARLREGRQLGPLRGAIRS